MIELINVNKTYKPKKGLPTPALKDINLTLPSTGLVFLIGKSGSGKSTLLNLLGCLDTPTSGKIVLNGKVLNKLKGKKLDAYRNTYMGFVFQDYNLLESLNVKKNLEISLALQKKKITHQELQEALEKIELKRLENRKVNELSGGQKQRIAILRALIKNPRILLCDEPTGNLDSVTSEQIFNLLKNISKDKLVIVVSHDIEFARLYADRIIEIKDGSIVGDQIINKIENEKEDLTLIKSRLTFIKSIPFALANLKKRKIRLLITTFLITITLSIFGFTHLLTNFNVTKSHAETMVRENTTEVEIKKTIPGKKLSETNSLLSFTEEELKEVTDKLNSKYTLSSRAISGDTILRFNFSVEHNIPFYYDIRPDIVNFILYDESELNKLKIIGTIPQNPNEVIINKLLADKIIYSGIDVYAKDKYGNDISELYKPSSYEELINSKHKIVVEDTYLIITGILDEDMSKYDILKETLANELYINSTPLSEEFENIYESKINNVIVKKDFFDTFISSPNTDIERDYFKTKGYVDDLVTYNIGLSYITKEYNDYFKKISGSEITYFDGTEYKHYTELKDNEIVLSIYQLYVSLLKEEEPNTSSYIDELRKEYEYKVKLREQQIEEELKKQEEDETYIPVYPPEIPVPDYFKLIREYVEQDIVSKNIIGKEMTIEIVDDTLRVQDERTVTKKFIIAGINLEAFTFVNKSNIEEYTNDNNEIYKITLNETNEKELEKIFNTFPQKNAKYISKTIYTTSINNLTKTVKQISKIAIYVSIGFLIFTIILTMNFIITSINTNKKEIGILKSLGARTKDIYKIYYLESFLIGIISCIISSIICYISVIFANELISKDLFFKIKPIIFDIKIILYTFIIMIIITIISSILPIFKISKTKPVESIYSK